MEYTIQELADMVGISSRTLRYYDEIGLLYPKGYTQAGYRLYGPEEVDRLQEILFYRELDVSLEVIRELLSMPAHDRLKTLKSHREALLQKRERLDLLIGNVTKTIESEKGMRTMTDQEKFEGLKERIIRENEETYGQEIHKKYGDEKVEDSRKKFQGLSEEQYRKMNALTEELLILLEKAVREGENPAGALGEKIASMHREWLSYTWPSYSRKAHQGLVEMYVQDERFRAYYDRRIPGCAKFLRDAVKNHC